MRVFLVRFVVGALLLVGAALASAQFPQQGKKKGGGGFPEGGFGGPNRAAAINMALPEGLRHVPTDALGFVYLRVGDFCKADIGQTLLKQLDQDAEAAKVVARIEQAIGIKLTDLESVTFLMTRPTSERLTMGPTGINGPTGFGGTTGFGGRKNLDGPLTSRPMREPREPREPATDDNHGALLIVTANRQLDRATILKNLAAPPAAQDPLARALGELSAVFLSDRCVVVGTPADLRRYVAQAGRREYWTAGGSVAPALALGTTPHLVVAGGYLPADMQARLLADARAPALRRFAPLLPLLNVDAGLTLDLVDNVELKVRFQGGAAERDMLLTLEAVKSLKAMAELALDSNGASQAPGLKALRKAVAHAIVEPQGGVVELSLRMPADPDSLARALTEVVGKVRLVGSRTTGTDNLKQIGVALHAYNDVYKAFPPAGLGDAQAGDRRLLSWRVALLPFLEQVELYKQFDLKLPWDHPHNKKLIPLMPRIYALPGVSTREPGLTYYRGLVGPGAAFEPPPGPPRHLGLRIAEFTDGTSNTLLVVEAHEPTIWTRPDDLPYDPNGPLPKFGAQPGGFQALFADGSVHFLPPDLPEATLRALITRNGGEVVQLP